MSNYTSQLRWFCEQNGRDSVENIFKSYDMRDYLSQSQIDLIYNTGIWTPSKLAKKIVDHFYTREIGFETYGLFKLNAKAFMNEIMEDYLPVIYSKAIDFDPLVNVDFTETFERQNSGESENSGKSNTTSNSMSIYSDTPNSGLNIENIKSGKYASNVSMNDNSSNIEDNATSKVSNIENYVKKTKGNSGVSATAQALIQQYRDIIRSVDREIIDDLEILFMGLF